MTALLVEAGDFWLLPFERIARIATAETLRPYAFKIPELAGLLYCEEGFLPVWAPEEFEGSGQVVVLYYGDDGMAGLQVSQVHGVREVDTTFAEHGLSLPTGDGRSGRWFDFDALESRLTALALSGGQNAEENIVG